MPGASKGRRNRRDRERERRRGREAAVSTDDDAEGATTRADARVASRAATPPSRGGASTDLPLPGPGVRITGLMVGIITTLGAAYMVVAGTLNGSGADSILSIGAGVVMLGIGAFVVALVLFPAQIRNFVRRGN